MWFDRVIERLILGHSHLLSGFPKKLVLRIFHFVNEMQSFYKQTRNLKGTSQHHLDE